MNWAGTTRAYAFRIWCAGLRCDSVPMLAEIYCLEADFLRSSGHQLPWSLSQCEDDVKPREWRTCIGTDCQPATLFRGQRRHLEDTRNWRSVGTSDRKPLHHTTSYNITHPGLHLEWIKSSNLGSSWIIMDQNPKNPRFEFPNSPFSSTILRFWFNPLMYRWTGPPRIRPWFFQKVIDQRRGRGAPGSTNPPPAAMRSAMRSAPGKGNILFQSKEDPLMQVRVP